MILGIIGSDIPPAVASDPFSDYVVSHLHWDGANGGTVFSDERPHTWTRNGSGVVTDTSQTVFGTASLFLPSGNGNYIASDTHVDFGFHTHEYTIEFWVRFSTLPASNKILVDFRTAGTQTFPTIYSASDHSLRYFWNGADRIQSAASVLTTNTWYHIALSRVGTNTRLFLNGTQVGSTFVDSNAYERFTRVILGADGSNPGSSSTWAGWIDELRISKGKGRYNGNFTVPTAAFVTATTNYLDTSWRTSGNVGPGLTYSESNTLPHLLVRNVGGNDSVDNGSGSLRSRSSGKAYFEVRVWDDGAWSGWCGITPAAQDLTSQNNEGPAIGAALKPARNNSTMSFWNNTTHTAFGTRLPSTSPVGVAVDFDTGKAWFRTSETNWVLPGLTLGAFDANNPTYTFTPGDPWVIYGSSPFSNTWCFLNVGPAFNYSQPVGYGYW